MGIHEHKAQTRSERLICSMDALTAVKDFDYQIKYQRAAINRLLDRLPESPVEQPALDNTTLQTGDVKTMPLSSPR